jgi:hypothetical protein
MVLVFISVRGRVNPMGLVRLEDSGKLKNIRRIASSGLLRRVALVRTDVSEELNASFIRVTRIGELGTKLAVTSNRRTLVLFLVHRFLST